MKNIFLKISYDGTDFHGWQRQPNLLTAQGEVERVLSILCAKDIRINGSSRTDAKVHALGQVANFKAEFSIPVDKIKYVANKLLHRGVQILEAKEVDENFNAISCTLNKTYVYKIKNTRDINPFHRNFVYYVEKELDVVEMRKGAEYIVGEHDFKCFQASGGEEVVSTVRRVNFLNIDKQGEDITIEINGNGFLYKMVRNIVGTLVEVGWGRREPVEVKSIIESKDRSKAGHTAEPQGLYLKEIFYE